MMPVFERVWEEDAAELIEVMDLSFYDDYVRFGECPGYHVPLEEMVQRIHRSIMFKILVDKRIIGNISVRPMEEGRYWLGCLAVIPEFQNRGIGSEAIRFLEKQFPDAVSWGLDTPVQKEGNCDFYEKMGYIGIEEKVISEKLTIRVYEKRMK